MLSLTNIGKTWRMEKIVLTVFKCRSNGLSGPPFFDILHKQMREPSHFTSLMGAFEKATRYPRHCNLMISLGSSLILHLQGISRKTELLVKLVSLTMRFFLRPLTPEKPVEL